MANATFSHGYEGPDRRVHRVYVTHNTEYHVRAGICVAVRDKTTGSFATEHPALGRRVEGGFNNGEGFGFHAEPQLGDALLFHCGKKDVITSRVERVTRPPKELTRQYP